MEDNVNQCWMKTQRKRRDEIPNVNLFLHYTSVSFNTEVLSEVLFCLECQKP